jgi:hypothetical protein
MIIEITLKDSDGIYDSITDALNAEVEKMDIEMGEDEKESFIDKRREKINEVLGEWVEYGEYLTLKVDIKKKTCEIVKVVST